jgi:DNA-binding SARP family transcriptional activator
VRHYILSVRSGLATRPLDGKGAAMAERTVFISDAQRGAIEAWDDEPPALRLINGFELRWHGATAELPRSTQRLLALLAIQTRPVQRVFVAGMLWPEASDVRAAAALRTALWRAGGARGGLVDAHHGRLSLSEDVAVDLRTMTLRARSLLREPRRSDLHAVDALLADGDLLPDWYDDWVIVERERFRQLRLQALDVLCEALVEKGVLAVAAEAGIAAVAADPLRESAHRALVRVHLAQGNACEALRQYEQCRSLLLVHLGLEPSGTMEELVAPLRARRARPRSWSDQWPPQRRRDGVVT